jgi:hypothetical protein
MSWLFSQALVEAYSADTCSDGAQSAPSSGNPTPQAFLSPDRMTAFSRPSRFGMTFKPLTDGLGAAVLMWCQEVSRARTSALPAREQALTEPAAACGDTWRGSLARFDPATSSWRTAQPSLLEDLGESSVTWPRSGMTAGGRCWELPMLEHRISGTGSGLLPRFPTPLVGGTGPSTHGQISGQFRREMAKAFARWPVATPTARDWRSGKASQATHARNSRPLSEQIGGSLNPTWVEWLMGWPLGWTDLKPLETDRFQQWPQQPGDY